ncbi:unnamed protein product [Chironomus riparius]|uniref:Uncharacterized protein n=1 Tax=Chironomus riparius TaxID=315576 RepID=A0A9N9RTC8_9DIPT|nr:unnamed protein product [Chironomus riparius]
MSDVHELTLREYYESFGKSLNKGTNKENVIIEHVESEVIYLGEEYEVIEILESDSDFDYTPEIIHESPKKPDQSLKVEHPKLDPLMLGKTKSLKAFRRNEDECITKRITRSSNKL